MILPRYYFSDEFHRFKPLFEKYPCKYETILKKDVLWGATAQEHISYYIEKGIAKVIIVDNNGTENIMFFFGPGSIYPIHAIDDMFSLENGHLFLVAVTDLEILSFPSKYLESMLREDGDFAVACVQHYSRFCNNLLTRSLMSNYNSSLQFVCSFLYLYLYYSPNSKNEIALTQDEVAKVTGLSLVHVARIFAKLRTEGVLETYRNRIRILSISALKQFCEDIILEQ